VFADGVVAAAQTHPRVLVARVRVPVAHTPKALGEAVVARLALVAPSARYPRQARAQAAARVAETVAGSAEVAVASCAVETGAVSGARRLNEKYEIF